MLKGFAGGLAHLLTHARAVTVVLVCDAQCGWHGQGTGTHAAMCLPGNLYARCPSSTSGAVPCCAVPLPPSCSARFVHVSSAGVTRPNRPGINVDQEPPAVKLNDTLGGLLTYKLAGEDAVGAGSLCWGTPCLHEITTSQAVGS